MTTMPVQRGWDVRLRARMKQSVGMLKVFDAPDPVKGFIQQVLKEAGREQGEAAKIRVIKVGSGFWGELAESMQFCAIHFVVSAVMSRHAESFGVLRNKICMSLCHDRVRRIRRRSFQVQLVDLRRNSPFVWVTRCNMCNWCVINRQGSVKMQCPSLLCITPLARALCDLSLHF